MEVKFETELAKNSLAKNSLLVKQSDITVRIAEGKKISSDMLQFPREAISLQLSVLSILGVLPVINVDDPDAAIEIADALTDGGLSVAEFTVTGEKSLGVISKIRQCRPDFYIGVGGLTSQLAVNQARIAGAKFAVGPAFDLQQYRYACAIGVAFVPTVMTVSEIMAAVNGGAKLIKFFNLLPENIAPQIFAEMIQPFHNQDVRFIPCGRISQKHIADWTKIKGVAAVAANWFTNQTGINEVDRASIKNNAQLAIGAVRASFEI